MTAQKLSLSLWQSFDEEWYRHRYRASVAIIEDIYAGQTKTYYQKKGYQLGHSPNPFFDEYWYLNRYQKIAEKVRKGIFKSGFDHYCKEGCKSVDYSPHWLFSEQKYRNTHPDFVQNNDVIKDYINGYDHYLKIGDKQLYSGSWFFDPNLYLKQKEDKDSILKEGPYHYLLKYDQSSMDQLRLSWYFDPIWYKNTYTDVEKDFKFNKFQNLLNHYLANTVPLSFSPLEWFSETFYIENNEDISQALRNPYMFRNGYEHFLLYGLNEKRQPCSSLDIKAYAEKQEVQEMIQQGLFQNAFEHWVAFNTPNLDRNLIPVMPVADGKVVISSEETPQADTKEEPTNQPEETVSVQEKDTSSEHNEIADAEKIKTEDIPQSITEPPTEQSNAAIQAADAKEDISSNETSENEVISETVDQPEIVNQDDEAEALGDVNTTPNEEDLVKFITSSKKQESSNEENSDQSHAEEEPAVEIPVSQEKHHMVEPIWRIFDEMWYIQHYPQTTSEMKALELDSVEEYYRAFGCYEGHSPNPFFDEKWYLENYPEVKNLVKDKNFRSGFEHYCKDGYQRFSPHWLFSENYYRERNPHLTDEALSCNGFVNGYDHYLKCGDKDGTSGSPFFDPYLLLAHLRQPIKAGMGPFGHYVYYIDQIDPLIRLSWYFDAEWYVKTYPEVNALIEKGEIYTPLQHYLINKEPHQYSPQFWFDEGFYNRYYKDMVEHQEMVKHYRNGYDHFIREGIEMLLQPRSDVDLESYARLPEVIKDIETNPFQNVFIHWVQHHENIPTDQEILDDAIDDTASELNTISVAEIDIQSAVWAHFDETWYLENYPDISEKMQACKMKEVQGFYIEVGALLGHSPNPYFDEVWYLSNYSDVRKSISRGLFKSGFEHYCATGYRTHSPHWLFSQTYYLQQNPEFGREITGSDNYVNAYDHYLKKGDGLRCSGSLMFDPDTYLRVCYQQGNVEKTKHLFRSYLYDLNDRDKDVPVSLYFDPKWYLETYPQVGEAIKRNEYRCALAHYLSNHTPVDFNPSPWFQEEFYAKTYPDITGAISPNGQGMFRNAYHHFILHGALECRQPHPDIDLKKYFLSDHVRDDIENGIFRDAFAHWVFRKTVEQWIDDQPDDSSYRLSEETKYSRKNFRIHSTHLMPRIARKKLDFSYDGTPDISVIMLVRNQLSITLSALASLRDNYSGKIQLLLGDNHSTDDTCHIEDAILGAEIARFPYNFGYGKACNILIKRVKAPVVVFLNNDIQLCHGAINSLCQRLLSDNTIGAVGGKIIHPDGKLQEAGSIIWRDGTTTGYLRGEDPLIPESCFVRDVDYCSTAMMAIRTVLLKELNGFSSVYYPAYFEDTDLCVRIIKEGYRIVYEPDAVVYHMEYASSDPITSSGLIVRNHKLFVNEHAAFLRHQHPRHSKNILMARQRRGKARRILFIEDRVPLRRLGSGYVRSSDIVHNMVDLGYEVTVFPVNNHYPKLFEIYNEFPETVEVLYDRDIDKIAEFFEERAGYYDIVWIGRTHNLNRLLPLLGEANRYLPQDGLILDTEVVAAPRTQLRNEVLGLENNEPLQKALEIELACARHCQEIVVVNEIDANYARQTGFGDAINILGHSVPIRMTPKTWSERKDFLFVGAIHDSLSPNYDSLTWFMKTVLPYLIEFIETPFKITIAGYVHPQVDMSFFAQFPQVELVGPVDDLTDLYNDHRVYIAPTRFAGGIPYKVHEAASFGIPVVASQILVDELGWKGEEDILSASIDDPIYFVSQIIRLYTEEKLWNTIRKNAVQRVGVDCNEEKFLSNLQKILNKIH